MRIGELAVASGTTTKTLRFYEEAGLLPAPERTANGYRDYTPAALARLDFVRRGRTAVDTDPCVLHQPGAALEVADGRISSITNFVGPQHFARFGLPATPYDAPPRTQPSPWH